jgi:ParB family transcriptional regulator, chromosome partitioning protein
VVVRKVQSNYNNAAANRLEVVEDTTDVAGFGPVPVREVADADRTAFVRKWVSDGVLGTNEVADVSVIEAIDHVLSCEIANGGVITAINSAQASQSSALQPPEHRVVRIAVCVRGAVPVASGPMARSGLGKGLGALIGTPAVAKPRDGSDAGERVHQIELASIVPSTLQPRKDFARDALLELIESIRQHGIIQPLIVRQVGTRFELIAGERRWRAAQELGLATVPAIVRTANDLEVLELSLIENLQRADLNPIEEAQGYARLANEFGMRQEDIALKVGRSRAAVANALRLLDLHPQVQIWLAQNLVSVGHAKVLLALKAPEEQLLAAETVLRRNATVRSTERMVARLLGIGRGRRKPRRAAVDSNATATAVEDLQNRLQQHLATHVTIHHAEKRGRIEIEYYGTDDLQRIISALGLPEPAD